jgi:tRNA A22 N-methylase
LNFNARDEFPSSKEAAIGFAGAHTEVMQVDMERAMKNPGSTFGTPEALEVSTELTKEQKRAVLAQWKDQLQQLQNAENENMQAPEALHDGIAELLKRVTTVIAHLNA